MHGWQLRAHCGSSKLPGPHTLWLCCAPSPKYRISREAAHALVLVCCQKHNLARMRPALRRTLPQRRRGDNAQSF